MYKLLSILLFAFGFAVTTEVYYSSDVPISGFQFSVEGCVVKNAYAGGTAPAGYMISMANTIILGFSLKGDTIPAGNGVLVVLDVEDDAEAACLTDLIISDSSGNALDASVEDCISIIISDSDLLSSPYGEIRGTITNLDGDPLIGTQVIIEELGIGSVADQYGNYGLINVPEGVYNVTAQMINYQMKLYTNVEVFKDKAVWLNFTLDCDTCPKPQGGSVNEYYDNSWAVLIGINEYEHVERLSYAVQDAEAIKKLLTSKFNFPKKNIIILTDAEATLTNIRTKLFEVAQSINKGDRLLVYFAGHGQTYEESDGGELGYLIPVDGNPDNYFATCLPMDDIKRISSITSAKHVLFLMDACYGGLLTVDTRSIKKSTPGYIDKITRDEARQIITAGGKGEEVIEKSEWGHSAFARNILIGLESGFADKDFDGFITADELGSFLIKRVSIDSDYSQTPVKRRFGSGEGEFVFKLNKKIENPITGMVSNKWGNNKSTSLDEQQLYQRLAGLYKDIDLYYGNNEVAKKVLKVLTEFTEQLEQSPQFIEGCTDENAINYNPKANLDDESCIILDSDDVYIQFGDFHNLDSTLDVFIASNRRIYNLEIFTKGFEIVDVLDGNLGLDNIKTSFDLEEIYINFSDSLNGYIIPKDETLLFKAKVLPTGDTFCFEKLTINDYDSENVQIGECLSGLTVQEVALSDTNKVEILSGEYAEETGIILQATEEGKYDILLEDSTIVFDVDPAEVNRLEDKISYNYFYIKNVDINKGIIEIGMNSLEEVGGFQFSIDGVSIMSGYGGAATENGFMISSNKTTTLGFSLSGGIIPVGRYTLVELEVSPINDAYSICIHGVVVSDPYGNAIDYENGECWVQ